MTKDELIDTICAMLEDPTTVIRENKPVRDDIHPTMKPVKLISYLIRNSSRKGENIIDLFGGSGTTLIACEQLDRTCFMMEYDPRYADAIVRRYAKLAGKTDDIRLIREDQEIGKKEFAEIFNE